MGKSKPTEVQKLQEKLEQHEQLLTQLIEMIAATNRRLVTLHESHVTKVNASL